MQHVWTVAASHHAMRQEPQYIGEDCHASMHAWAWHFKDLCCGASQGVDIFEKDFLFLPIHDHLHWSLVIICHAGAPSEDNSCTPWILHLDSMSCERASPTPIMFPGHFTRASVSSQEVRARVKRCSSP